MTQNASERGCESAHRSNCACAAEGQRGRSSVTRVPSVEWVKGTRYPAGDWETARLDAGIDRRRLDAAIDTMMRDRESVGLTQALVIVRDGTIVGEFYGPGGDASTRFVSWSMAKSITNALVGLALGEGRIDLDASSLFPEWSGDARSGITLRHLLSMTSGLAWAEDYVDAGVSNVIEMLFLGQEELPTIDEHGRLDPRRTRPVDAAGYALARPLEAPPGTKYLYSSGTTNLVCRYVARQLGERAGSSEVMSRFMHERLFAPIGMNSADPVFDGAGTFVGSSYVYATARDFARFGWLYANDGTWNGTRLLPEQWVRFSATEIARDPENELGYGAHWWVFPDDEGSMSALGYEGQYTYVSPRRDLVIVRLGGTDATLNPNLRACIGEMVRAFPVMNR